MVASHLERIFFHSIIRNQAYVEMTLARFFDDPILRKLFPPVKEFWEKYKQTPSRAQVVEIVRVQGTEGITEALLDELWRVDLGQYDEEWLRENTETFIEFKNLDLSMIDASNLMRTTVVNAENIKSLVETVKGVINGRNSLDFSFDEGSDFFDPKSHEQPTANTFRTGFPFIDQVSDGGLATKTLTVFVGQPKIGKCFFSAGIITIRNKKTHLVEKITIGEFHERCMQGVRKGI